ncbi:hypothetical protein [Pseudogulbenkiania sp. MAI-1]|uniref:hypothetical protein n=1 Tax=Pseudogulbenkiania sp. MAI-1 TaxID=990370 RepID=UPI00045EC3C7|nr:hypothetical protein [Pseudogulbenkiania sp. MAI-1]
MSPGCFRRRLTTPRTHSSATATPAGVKQTLLTFFKLLLTTLFLVLGANSAFAADPDHVSLTLEGCRNNGDITLPNSSGQFVCPDTAYTTGNLGKGWNELDLVPYRLTVQTGSSSPANQSYTLAVVVDNEDAGHPGYDVLSTLTKKSGSCTISVGAQNVLSPGIGGTDKSLYRLVTITQAKNTTCVFDYYARLALGSHLYPGSSLHANLTNETFGTAGIGARDVSIPVKEILPQELRKDMTAVQDTDFTWNITKEAKPTDISFGNVCAKDFSDQKPVEITIKWTKSAAIPGVITVTTNVYAKNPAARTITVNVTDKIYKGTTPTIQVGTTASSGPVDVPANTELKVLTNTQVLSAADGSEGSFNDVATATYIDKVTGIPVPGNTEAKASATIGTGTTTNATAVITDTESITGNFLKFSVDSLGGSVPGSFDPAYVLGTPTTGPVNWTSGEQSTSGSVVFNKVIHLDGQKITTGTLTDTATLKPKDGAAQLSGPVVVTIDSDASAELTIKKSIDAEAMSFLATGEKYVIKFTVTRLGDATYKELKELTFNPGDASPKSVVLDGLVPDTYLVDEEALFVNAQGVSTSGVISDPSGSQRTVNLTVVNSTPTCTGTAEFNNKRAFAPASAQVQKITEPALQSGDPDFQWTFTLTGPGAGAGVVAIADANGGYVPFQVGGQPFSLAEGSYTVTETTKTGWDLSSVNSDPALKTCTFTVDYPADAGRVFSCTFKNVKRAEVQVIKTFKGLPITGSEVFTFSLRTGASASSDGTTLQTLQANAANGGTITFDKVVPGNYQLCEQGVLPGWTTSLASLPGAFFPPNGGDNSTVCVGFTLNAGDFKQITVDNVPPPEGQARTIGFWKNWASCKQSSGKQAPVLDQTMAKAEPTGIQVDGLYLHGSVATPDKAPDCSKAVSLLNKSTFDGKKKASDPLFNMAAQLVAAELNYAAGAAQCAKVTDAIKQANDLLTKYQFTGYGYTGPLSSADASLANSLAKRLDDYNNNLPSACL